MRCSSALAIASVAFTVWFGFTQAAAQTPWTFVSSPDLFNGDLADLSGGTDPAIAAFFDADYPSNIIQAAGWAGVNNDYNTNMASAYNTLLTEMHTNAGGSPEAFVVAGDLISGRWNSNATRRAETVAMFAPGGTQTQAVQNATDVYFTWYRELFRQNGFDTVVAALGDHDVGDNDWATGSIQSQQVITMKEGFGRNMVDVLGLPAQINGVNSRAPGDYQYGSFAKQINNVMFLTVDVFRQDDPNTQLHYRHGSVSPEVAGAHLQWVDDILAAADTDPTIDHVIVQGHTPILPAVRKQSSSGMMFVNRDGSPFWQTLQAHSHNNGGKVRMYYGGEVHSITSTKDANSDIVQIVHGDPPFGNGSGNYVVFSVDGDRIEAELYTFEMRVDQGGKTPSTVSGSLVIDAGGAQTTYQASGLLDFVEYRGLVSHYGLDEDDAATTHANTGTVGNWLYEVDEFGDPTTVPGKFGNALDFDDNGDYLRNGNGLALITEGEQRTVSAWVKPVGAGWDTVVGYGGDNKANGEFNFRVATGNVQLNIDNSVNAFADNPLINDDQWHHVVVVLPNPHENMLSDVLFYVDGVEYAARIATPDGNDKPIRTFAGTVSRFYIGADAENLGNNNHFNGAIDDVALYGTALSADEVKGMFDVGDSADLAYGTLKFDQLRKVHNGELQAAAFDGLQWTRATGLTGAAGLSGGGNSFTVVLDATGDTGVVSGLLGDVERDGDLDTEDIDALYDNLGSNDGRYDVALDGGPAGSADVDALVRDVLGTEYGDANNDKQVSLIDLNALGANFGNAGVWATGDFNGDGQVSLADLNTLGVHFGFDGTGGVFVPSVPEPGALVLLAVGALGLKAGGRERPR